LQYNKSKQFVDGAIYNGWTYPMTDKELSAIIQLDYAFITQQ